MKSAAAAAARPKPKTHKLVRKQPPPYSPIGLAPAAPKLLSGPSQPAVSGELVYDRRLELELMHQWTTKTWMGFYGIPEDQRYLQEELPRTALGEGYLLNGILAIAATDLAHQTQGPASSKYVSAALGYSNRASIQFRQQLSILSATNNTHVLYHRGIIVEKRNLSMMKSEVALDAAGGLDSDQSKLQRRFNTFFDILLTAYNILLTNMQWTMNNPSEIRAAIDRLLKDPLTLDFIGFDTRLAMERLTSVSQQIRDHFSNSRTEDAAAPDAPPLGYLCAEVPMYRLIIAQVKLSFVVEALNLPQGFCLSLVTTTGLEFLNLVIAMDTMALFVLLHVGVIFYRMFQKEDKSGWAMSNIAQELIKELSRILEATPVCQIPEGREAIVWCQQQVGLLPTPGAGTLVIPDVMFDQDLNQALE